VVIYVYQIYNIKRFVLQEWWILHEGLPDCEELVTGYSLQKLELAL